ncbi:MAG: Rieske (2Fe-2S) protein [Pseudomonadota bacterium]|nr:Rieske (2Fe-2S) protein [Pseudomonadota bacterium]
MADQGAPQPGQTLCRLDEIADPGSKGFSFWTGEMVFRGFVVRRGDEVKGWRDRCPHIGTPLTFGDDRYLTRDGAHLICVTHGALFRPEDGMCVAGPCAGQSLRAWPVQVRDGAVIVAADVVAAV